MARYLIAAALVIAVAAAVMLLAPAPPVPPVVPTAARPSSPDPSPSRFTPAPTASSSSDPAWTTRSGAVTREMLSMIVRLRGEKAPAQRLKACYDAIRALGPDAIPALLVALKERGTAEFTMAAINALTGLRASARGVAKLQGSDAALAAKLDLPVEAIAKWRVAGPWSDDVTQEILHASWEVVQSAAPEACRLDAVSAMYVVGEDTPAAATRLVEAARIAGGGGLRDRALALAASLLSTADASPLSRLALDGSLDEELRLKAGMAYLDAMHDRGPLPDRAALQASLLPAAERRGNTELIARLTDDPARVAALLQPGADDARRCGAIKGLVDGRGLDAVRAELEKIAAEEAPTSARDLARKLLR